MIPEEKRSAALAKQFEVLAMRIPGLEFRGFLPVSPVRIQPSGAWKQVARIDFPASSKIDSNAPDQSLHRWFLESTGVSSSGIEVDLSIGGFGVLPWGRFLLSGDVKALPEFWLSTESQEMLVLLKDSHSIAAVTCEEYEWELRRIPARALRASVR